MRALENGGGHKVEKGGGARWGGVQRGSRLRSRRCMSVAASARHSRRSFLVVRAGSTICLHSQARPSNDVKHSAHSRRSSNHTARYISIPWLASLEASRLIIYKYIGISYTIPCHIVLPAKWTQKKEKGKLFPFLVLLVFLFLFLSLLSSELWQSHRIDAIVRHNAGPCWILRSRYRTHSEAQDMLA